MARIVILGAGLGGVPMAYEMREQARDEDTVTVINENPHFEFVPSNPWVGVGTRKKDDVHVDLDKPFSKKGLELVVGRAKKVVPSENRVELEDGQSVDYDHLIIATGARLAFDEIPGLGPDGGYTQSVCKTDHAERTWEQYQKLLENPGPVIIGAAQAASCYGPAYEFAFLLDYDLRKRGLRDKVPMTFVTAEPYVGHMGLAGVGESQIRLKRLLGEHEIDYIANNEVVKVEDGAMTVRIHGNGEGEAEEKTLPFNFAMMIPAFTGIDAVRNIEGLVNPRGFVLIDDYQRNPTFPNVWSVGVAVAIPPVEKTPVATGVPKTGYMIEGMVTAAATNIRAVLDGKEPLMKATGAAICLADMGNKGMAVVAIPQLAPRRVDWASEGKWVHLAKLAFEKYFIRKVKHGVSERIYERYVLKALGITKTEEEKT